MSPARPQGQPVLMLASILLGWVLVRIAIMAGPEGCLAPPCGSNHTATLSNSPAAETDADTASPDPPVAQAVRTRLGPPNGVAGWGLIPSLASVDTRPDPMRLASVPESFTPRGEADQAAPVADAVAARQSPESDRWSGDGWLLLRGFGASPAALMPRYGASQVGAIARLRLAVPRSAAPFVYLRATAATAADERDVAAGLSLRPLPDIPLDLAAEARLSQRGARVVLRPAVGAVAAVPRQSLPWGLSAEAYGQAGWVGGPGESLYGDAQVHLGGQLRDRTGRHLRGGVGLWAGAQRGAGRVDIGPAIELAVPFGRQAHARIEADWRFRIVGRAEPGSGPAVVLAVSF